MESRINFDAANFYIARKKGGRWNITHRLIMPKNSSTASAFGMAFAAGVDRGFDILYPFQLKQKNVNPVTNGLIEIEYDAAEYWNYKLTTCHPESRDMWKEAAEKEGVIV